MAKTESKKKVSGGSGGQTKKRGPAKTAKKTNSKKSGEQLELIDVGPKNAQAIADAAHRYKKAQSIRLKALDREIELKGEVLRLVKAAKLQPLKGGAIKLRCQGTTITVTPRNELITVKEDESDK